MNEIKEQMKIHSACFIDCCMLGMRAAEKGEFEKSDRFYEDAQNSLAALRNLGENSRNLAISGLIKSINESHDEFVRMYQ